MTPGASQSRALSVQTLAIRGFRNLGRVDLTLGPRFNVFHGENGQGKTNLLEAVYAVLTSKSFRATRPQELIAHGEGVASVRATLREEGDLREQSLGLKPGVRLAMLDGKRPKNLATFAVASPVVVFHPGVVTLSMGGGTERRRLLDRVALYASPASLAELDAYQRVLRERQRALETRGPDARDLGTYEDLLVRHGRAVSNARREAAERIGEVAAQVFRRIAPQHLSFAASYAPGAPEDDAAYREALEGQRVRDQRRGSATVGPHRDDLTLVLGEHPARGVASQGQHRAIVLALKLAEIDVIGAARGVRPILLLDDVSSELDGARTEALFDFLGGHRGQVLLTTTRPELFVTGALAVEAHRRNFRVEGGRIEAELG